MSQTAQTLERRVARLERSNRFLLAVCCTFAVGFGCAAVAGSATVRAERIQLIAADGSLRAELALREGQPGLYLMDTAGMERVAVLHDAQTSGVYVKDAEGVTRIGVAQFAHGGGGVALHGPHSKGAAVLYLKESGSLRFFDGEGAVTNQVLAAP